MRKLGEQWVEEIDGKKHMLKLVPSIHLCSGCVFSNKTFCSDPMMSERNIDCSKTIIKDLGILNEDGCLPAPWNIEQYPEIYPQPFTDELWFVQATIYGIAMKAKGKTRQQAIDTWNRRA